MPPLFEGYGSRARTDTADRPGRRGSNGVKLRNSSDLGSAAPIAPTPGLSPNGPYLRHRRDQRTSTTGHPAVARDAGRADTQSSDTSGSQVGTGNQQGARR
jgi:hypothetical protein